MTTDTFSRLAHSCLNDLTYNPAIKIAKLVRTVV